MSITLMELWGRWVDCPGYGRSVAFRSLPQRNQDSCWEALAAECRERTEYERSERYLDPLTRHQPLQRSTAATSRKSAAVELSSDDPLKKIEPRLLWRLSRTDRFALAA